LAGWHRRQAQVRTDRVWLRDAHRWSGCDQSGGRVQESDMSAFYRSSPHVTRREFGRIALAGLSGSVLLSGIHAEARQKIDSRIKNVDLGAITYSFRGMTNPDEIIKAYVTLGLGSMELMSNHAEALAGMPAGPGRGNRGGQLTPEQQAAADAATKARNEWKRSATTATWAPVRKKIEDA